MRRQRLPQGFTRFSVETRFRSPAMVGTLLADFHVSNGTGYAEPSLLFTVKP